MIAQSPSPDSPSRRLPLAVQLLRTGLDTLAWVAPKAAGDSALRLFGTPQRFAEPRREQTLRQEGTPFQVPFRGLSLDACSWGAGPAVLLVHGWSGRAGQLGALVEPLAAEGFRVVAFDLPAHGRSGDSRSTLYEAAEAVRAVADAVAAQSGPLRAVVAHSFGAAATSLALHDGLAAGAAVYIAPTGHIEQGIASFVAKLGLGERSAAALRRSLERQYGQGIWRELAVETVAEGLRLPCLVIHDVDDREVPFSEGESVVRAWAGARLLATRGLGHNRILWNPGVVEAAVAFVRNGGRDGRAATAPREELALVS
jgi:pimeloyl-ACP methyl ester carboxylesterase